MRKEHESSLGAGAESPGCFLWAQPLAWGAAEECKLGAREQGRGTGRGLGVWGFAFLSRREGGLEGNRSGQRRGLREALAKHVATAGSPLSCGLLGHFLLTPVNSGQK